MDRSMPGLPVHHQLPEFTQTHAHRVGDAIQPSHPLSSPSPPAPNPSRIRIFSNESTLHMRWPKYWSFSFSISPSNEHFRNSLITLKLRSIPQLMVCHGLIGSCLFSFSEIYKIMWLLTSDGTLYLIKSWHYSSRVREEQWMEARKLVRRCSKQQSCVIMSCDTKPNMPQ